MFLVYIHFLLYRTDAFTNTFTDIFANTALNRGGRASKGCACASAGAPQAIALRKVFVKVFVKVDVKGVRNGFGR